MAWVCGLALFFGVFLLICVFVFGGNASLLFKFSYSYLF